MYISQDEILGMATKVVADITFSEDMMGKRTYNAVMKALRQGYIATRGGAAAKYYGIITNHYKLPCMRFSRSASYWDGVSLYKLPDECATPLSEFWQADRVMFRLEKPEEYEQALSGKYYSNIRDAIKEPNFNDLVRDSRNKDHAYMRILKSKDTMFFDAIAKEYITTPEYLDKLEAATEFLKRGGTMQFKLKGD